MFVCLRGSCFDDLAAKHLLRDVNSTIRLLWPQAEIIQTIPSFFFAHLREHFESRN